MSNAHQDLFDRLAQAQAPSDRLSKLAIGRHRVILKSYRVKPMQKKNQNGAPSGKLIIEANFMVLESQPGRDGQPVHAKGDSKEWAFFPGGDEFGYADGRSKAFIGTVGACVGDARPVNVIGGEMAGPNQFGRGVVMDVVVDGPTEADGSPKRTKKGEVVTNATWFPVPQTIDQVAGARRKLDEMEPRAPAQQAAPPQGYGQPNPYAPPPAQGGYPQQPPPNPYGAPQGAPNPYAPPPAQGGYPQQPPPNPYGAPAAPAQPPQPGPWGPPPGQGSGGGYGGF